MSDFESGAFNRALPTLRFVYNKLQETPGVPAFRTGSFAGTLYRHYPLHRCLLKIHTQVCVPLGHLCRPVPQEFSDRVQVHSGHYQSTGEGIPIAMPGVIHQTGPQLFVRNQRPAVQGTSVDPRSWFRSDKPAAVPNRPAPLQAVESPGPCDPCRLLFCDR